MIEIEPSTESSSPNPTRLDGAARGEDFAEEHRNVYCSRYDRCLSFAIREGWDSFTCSACAYRLGGGQQPEDYAEQRRGDWKTA
jgi:hypothetical protein